MFYRKGMRAMHASNMRASVSIRFDDCWTECDNVRRAVDGRITSFGQFRQMDFPHNAVKVLFYNDGKLYVAADDGLYMLGGDEWSCVLSCKLADCSWLYYDRKMIFSGVNAGTHRIANGKATELWVTGYNSMTVAGSRIIGAAGTSISVAPAGKTDDWSNSVTVNPFYACQTVEAIGEVAYALGEECYAFRPRAAETDMSFHPVASNVGKVQRGSAVNLGKKIVFASQQGLYKLQSDGVSRIFSSLDGFVRFDGAVACQSEGKYLVSCKSLDGDGTANDITLLLDVDSQRVCGVLHTGFDALYGRGSDLFAVREGKLFRFVSGEGVSVLRKQNIDMGSKKMKFLHSLSLLARCNADVFVESDGVRRQYAFYGSDRTQTRRIVGHGKEFAVEVRTDNGMDIGLVRLDAHAIREVSLWR